MRHSRAAEHAVIEVDRARQIGDREIPGDGKASNHRARRQARRRANPRSDHEWLLPDRVPSEHRPSTDGRHPSAGGRRRGSGPRMILVQPTEQAFRPAPERRRTAPRSSALRACHSVPASSVRENAPRRRRAARPAGRPGRARGCRSARRASAGRQDADQVERVGAGQRDPGIRRPACAGSRATAPTASGSANCSPEKPATKRPPRISPRASSRR